MSLKVRYLVESSRKRLTRSGSDCPCCAYPDSDVVSRKYGVTTLERCRNCRLLFRVPTVDPEKEAAFYQDEYEEGFTTATPTASELTELLDSGFVGSEKDIHHYLAVLAALSPGGRIFDFGCSWGYGSWQMDRAGFEVESFEVSRPRRQYAATHLGVKTHDVLPEPTGEFDVFFSSHVLEHVPSPLDTIDFGLRMVKPGGFVVAFTPNACEPQRRADPKAWDMIWGRVHPCLPDDVFYLTNSVGRRTYLSGSPCDTSDIHRWALGQTADSRLHSRSGDELLFITQRP